MDVVYPRCCGVDIHKRTAVACLIVPGPDVAPCKEVRTFGTTTAELEALSAWLAAHGVTHVAMEGTGVYWQPVYNLLEDRFALVLANARHIKAVPGRKTDVRDCEWIADLLRHGLLRASFVPDRAQRELRELTRYRTALVRERADETNRLQKTLEGANVKLASVVTDVLGRSGRAMLDALAADASDPAAVAALARGSLREKRSQLEQALTGRLSEHQRFLLARQLQHIDQLHGLIEEVSMEINRRLGGPTADPTGEPPARRIHRPRNARERAELVLRNPAPAGSGEAAVQRLTTIPGVGRRTAEILVAEIGTDMQRFPTAAHLASWTGMCPGNRESGGKRLSGRTRKGSPWLRAALVEAAHAAARSKGSYLAAQYRRLAARRGAKKAAVAVGHSILVSVWHLLEHACTYVDLGPTYFDELDRQRVERRLVHRLETLGYGVQLTPRASAA